MGDRGSPPTLEALDDLSDYRTVLGPDAVESPTDEDEPTEEQRGEVEQREAGRAAGRTRSYWE
jgi:hypothetical protein